MAFTPSGRNESIELPLQPRLKCNNLAGVYFAVLDGLGIADLPYLTVEHDIASGKLIPILSEWCPNIGTVQLVYASRGQRLLVEKLIQVLMTGLRVWAQEQPNYLSPMNHPVPFSRP